MNKAVTPAEAQSFLNTFFDLDFVNKSLIEEKPELGLGKKIETMRLRCVNALTNTRKFYHITLYEFGYIAHYGRLDKDLKPKYQTPHIKGFNTSQAARNAFLDKIYSKKNPSGNKRPYSVVEYQDHMKEEAE